MSDREVFDAQLIAEQSLAEQIPDKEAAWEAEKKNQYPALDKKYMYAYVLTKSESERHKVWGMRLMEELIQAKYQPVEDCLYAIAVCQYTLGRYPESKEYCEQLLRRNPDHRYANQLYGFVKEAIAYEDKQVAMVTGGAIAVGVIGVALGLVFGAKRRR